ncbi:hypothetical protein PH547_33015 [Rhizobium sp. CNPSo 3464]|nr:hypothetical protein [Rhizobium sp. CNPSo 3464]
MIGVFSALICVMLPGWGLKQFLRTRGMKFRDGQASALLSSFALGVHINAIIFLGCWTFANPAHPLHIAAIIVAINLLIALVGIRLAPRSQITIDAPLFVLAALGIIIGVFAAIRFPNTLDSVQIFQVQKFMLGWDGGYQITGGPSARLFHLFFGGLEIPTQAGFGGLTLIPALLLWSLPVATAAAANKILLFSLAAVVSLYSARRFGFNYTLLAAAIIFCGLTLSQFGLYGLFSTGKDSAFAILMALASLAALADDESEAVTNEPGLFMSAAILLGAVVVPFLMIFWAFYVAFSGGRMLSRAARQAIWCIYPLIVGIIGVHAVFATPDSHFVSLLPALVAGFVGTLILLLIANRVRGRSLLVAEKFSYGFALVPALCVSVIAAIMPVTGHIITGYQNGLPITASYPPLDGITTARDFLLSMNPANNSWLCVFALASIVVTPILSRKFRTPFYLAFFCFLPATALFALLNVKLGLHLLPDFNLWDISRDTVQWYLGAFGAVYALIGAYALLYRVPVANLASLAITIFVIAGGLAKDHQELSSTLSLLPTVTASGGSSNPITAVAMDFIWREARNSTVYISTDSPFEEGFNGYYLFGPKRVEHFDPKFIGTEKEQAFLTSATDMVKVLQPSTTMHGSGYVQPVGDNAFMIKLVNDGKSAMDLRAVPEMLVNTAGAYAIETVENTSFRWASRTVKIDLIRPKYASDDYCPTLKFVNVWGDPDLAIQIQTAAESKKITVPKGANFVEPSKTTTCLHFDENGAASINLTANNGEREFPNDARKIAFGLLWPIH